MMQEILHDEILEKYSKGRRSVLKWLTPIIAGSAVGVILSVVVGLSFNPDDAPIFDIKYISNNLTIVSIVLSVVLFLFNQIADRSKELHGIGNEEMSREIIEAWTIKFVTYKIVSFFVFLLVYLLTLIGVMLTVSGVFDTTERLYNIWGGSISAQMGSGTLIISFSFLMIMALIQVDPDPAVHLSTRIGSKYQAEVYKYKSEAIMKRVKYGVGFWAIMWLMRKSRHFRRWIIGIKLKIYDRNFFGITLVVTTFLSGAMVFVYCMGGAQVLVDFIVLYGIGFLLFCLFFIWVYQPLLVINKYSMSEILLIVQFLLVLIAYSIVAAIIVWKINETLVEFIDNNQRVVVFIIGLTIPHVSIFILSMIFTHSQYRKLKINNLAADKPPILYRSAVKTMEDYKQRIKELDSELRDSLEKSQSTRQAAGNAKLRYRSKATQPPFRPRRR